MRFTELKTDEHTLPIGEIVLVDSPNQAFYINGSLAEIISYLVKKDDGHSFYMVRVTDLNMCQGSGRSMVGTTKEIRANSARPLRNNAYKHLLRR